MTKRAFKLVERSRSIYLPQEMWEKLRALASREDRSVSYIIRKAIEPLLESVET